MTQNDIYNVPLKLCNAENRNAIKVEREGEEVLHSAERAGSSFKQCNMTETNKCFCRGDWFLGWCIDTGGVDLKDAVFQQQFFKSILGTQWHFHFLCKKSMCYLPQTVLKEYRQKWAFGSYLLVCTKLFLVFAKIKSHVYMHGYILERHRQFLRNGNPKWQ